MTKITGDIDLTPTNYSVTDTRDVSSHFEGIDAAIATEYGRVGTLMIWAGEHTDLPSNALICDGSYLSTEVYHELYDVIGTIYGSGDGTFRLPAWTGKLLRGLGGGTDPDSGSRTDRGDGTTGNNIGTFQSAQHDSHSHGLNRNTNNLAGGGGGRSNGSGTGMSTTSAGSIAVVDTKYVLFAMIFRAQI